MEEPELVYEDEAFTIILSAEGNQEDVSKDMKDFLHYLATKEVGSDLTKRLEEKVQAARKHENWRLEYMTLLERDERMREEGRQEGLQEGEKTLADLINRLITEGRMDEVKRAVDDREFRKSLYAEYGINKK